MPTEAEELRVARVGLAVAPFAAIALAALLTGSLWAVLGTVLAASAILAAAACLGASALRWLAPPRLTAVERAGMAVAAGVGIIGVLVLSLGFAGVLSPATALVTVFGAAALAALHARPWRGARRLWRELVALTESPMALALLAAAALFLGVLLAVALVPLWDWDSLMYHIPVPRLFLQQGTVMGPPDAVHYGFVGSVHALYVLALAVGAPAAATVVSGLLGLLLAVLVLRVACDELQDTPAALAVAGLAGSAVVAFIALTPRVDVSLALSLFLAHYALIRLARGGSPRFILLAGLFGGVALATKLHAGAYLLPLALWAVWLTARGRVRPAQLLLGTALGLLVAGPWLLRSTLVFGDPLFPLLFGTGVPPWMHGDPRLVEAADAIARGVLGRTREPVSLWRILFDPGALSPEPEARYYIWSPLLLVGGLVILVTPSTWPWALPAVAYAAILFARSLRTNLRYLVPALPALAVAAATALDVRLTTKPRLRRGLTAALFVASLAPLAVPVGLTWSWLRNPIESGRYGTIYAAAAAASEAVPPDGTIVMLYEARRLPFDRHVLPDTRLLTWPLLAASGHADECLRDLPVTHVLLNVQAFEFYRARVGSMPFVTDDSLERFVRTCLEPVAERGGHVLFRLRREPHQAAPGINAGARAPAAASDPP